MTNERRPQTDQEWAEWIVEHVFEAKVMTVADIDEQGLLELLPKEDRDKDHWHLHRIPGVVNQNHFLNVDTIRDFVYSVDGYIAITFANLVRLHGAEKIKIEQVTASVRDMLGYIAIHHQSLHDHVWEIWTTDEEQA